MRLSRILLRSLDTTGEQRRRVEDAFAAAIRGCTSSGDVAAGRQLHRQISAAGLDGNKYLGNLLVQMYGQCCSPAEARAVFDTTRPRNAFSWNILILAYAHNGLLLEAERVFDSLPVRIPVAWNSMLVGYTRGGHLEEAKALFDQRPVQDVMSLNIMLTAYAHSGDVQRAKSMFDRLPDDHVNIVCWNNLLTAFSQNGYMQEARQLFYQAMPQKDLVSWNIMLGCCCEPVETMQCFRTMIQDGMKPDKSSFTLAAESCSTGSLLAHGKWLYSLAVETGTDCQVGIAMVNMFTKCGSLRDAELTFDRMPRPQEILAWTALLAAYAQAGDLSAAWSTFESMPSRDVVVWTAVVNAYGQAGAVDRAAAAFARMPQLDVVACNAMVIGYAHNGRIQDARRVFDSMVERWSTSWTSMVSAYAQAGLSKEALELFKHMDLDGMAVNEVTLVSAMDACAGCSASIEATVIRDEAEHRGLVNKNTIVASALVNMLAKCGHLDEARTAFGSIPRPTIVSWTVIISAFARAGRALEVANLFSLMELEGEIPNWLTLSTILSACSHGGQLDVARHHFVRMWGDYGIQPGYDHYVCMVNLLGRSGQLESMEDLLAAMPFYTDRIALTAGLEACRLHGDTGRGACIAGHVMDVSDASAPYMLLANLVTDPG